jgi:hypothetical protein
MNNNLNNSNNNNFNGDTRSCQIVLIDGRKLDFLIQPKLSSADLLDLVASHFYLKEKEYFGLAFIDSTLVMIYLKFKLINLIKMTYFSFFFFKKKGSS